MKLIFAIVGSDDSHAVSTALTRSGYSVTKLATTGGFLRAGNTTFLIGVEDEKVDTVIDIISTYSRQRTQTMPDPSVYGMGMYANYPVEIKIGGATVFVVDVEKFIKL